MKISLLIFFINCYLFESAIAQQPPALNYISKVWVADQGNGTYKNPILFADYSDPDVIRVGEDYYLTASSFNCTPGLPILHSKDLVNWSILAYALPKQVPLEWFNKPQHGNGVWAPSIRYHKGEFYIYYPDPDFGVYVIKAKNAAGPWSTPVLVDPGKGIIDPCPLWDDDGKVYLVHGWAASRAEINSILTVQRLSTDGLKTIDDGVHIIDGHEDHPTLEGPKIFKRHGYYYVSAPGGGVTTGWQVVFRSKNIYGPYESKIVLAQGSTSTNGPHQGAIVETQTGENWFLHFQDKGAYGRILHLEPVKWIDDWPFIGVHQDESGKGEPVLTYRKPSVGKTFPIITPQESDEFNDSQPGLQWQWHANPSVRWSAQIPGSGFLRLFAIRRPEGSINFWDVPNLLMQKFPAPDFTVTTKVSLTSAYENKKAGLIIMGGDYSYLCISKEKKNFSLSQVICKNAETGGREEQFNTTPLNDSLIYMRVSIHSPNASCTFSYSLDGKTFIPIGESFIAKPDKWIGAKVGIFCNSAFEARNGGYADFDWFRVDK